MIQFPVLNSRICLPYERLNRPSLDPLQVTVCVEAVSNIAQRLAQVGETIEEAVVGSCKERLLHKKLVPLFKSANGESTPSRKLRSLHLEVAVFEDNFSIY